MKTKALISCTVSEQLICTFVFAYAKSRFYHDVAHIKTALVCTQLPVDLIRPLVLMDGNYIEKMVENGHVSAEFSSLCHFVLKNWICSLINQKSDCWSSF